MKTLARNTDPDSSHLVANWLDAEGISFKQCEKVLMALKNFEGTTSAELAKRSKFDRHLVARRLSDLKNKNLVYQGESKKCSVNNRSSVTWWTL